MSRITPLLLAALVAAAPHVMALQRAEAQGTQAPAEAQAPRTDGAQGQTQGQTPGAQDQTPAPGAAPGAAQGQPGADARPGSPARTGADPQEAERRGLTTPEVKKSLAPEPTDQGARAPNTHVAEGPDLYGLLKHVRTAPPGLDGKPIRRPNDLGSEPAKEMEPAQPEDLSLFPENYVE